MKKLLGIIVVIGIIVAGLTVFGGHRTTKVQTIKMDDVCYITTVDKNGNKTEYRIDTSNGESTVNVIH